jgi:hypothetical protein
MYMDITKFTNGRLPRDLNGLEERINKLEEIADEFKTQEFLNHQELMEAIDALVGWREGTEA